MDCRCGLDSVQFEECEAAARERLAASLPGGGFQYLGVAVEADLARGPVRVSGDCVPDQVDVGGGSAGRLWMWWW